MVVMMQENLTPAMALKITEYLLHEALTNPLPFEEGWLDPDTGIAYRETEQPSEGQPGWVSYLYDVEADVLYLSVGKPVAADDGDLTDDNLIVRYKNHEIIGITVLDASRWENRLDG